MKVVKPNKKHQAFRDALINVVRKHGKDLDAKEILALVSHMVGQLIALQDHRTISSDIALEIVMNNIERGNIEIVEGLIPMNEKPI